MIHQTSFWLPHHDVRGAIDTFQRLTFDLHQLTSENPKQISFINFLLLANFRWMDVLTSMCSIIMNWRRTLMLTSMIAFGAIDLSLSMSLDSRKPWRWNRFSNAAKRIFGPSPTLLVQNDEEKSVNREMMRVSFFSFLHNAAMPFADLVDGSFLSTLDANSLGAVGIVRASQVRNDILRAYS